MNYIVFDLEWNQCPDGKAFEDPLLPFEIIEIGAIKLDSSKQEIDRFHEFVHPVVYPKLHHTTNEIIHLSASDLETAASFPEVIERFRIWCGSDVVYCTWGNLDLLELQRNLRHYQLPDFLPYPLKYLDIQKIFSLVMEDGKSRRSLEYAADFLGIEKSVPFHEALSDAFYTAKVMAFLDDEKLNMYYSIDYFRCPKNRRQEIYSVFENYSKFVSMAFPSKSALMRDRKVTSTKCYLCEKTAKKKIQWFLSGAKNYSCLAYCEEHGYLKGKIRIKKAEDGSGFFCVKTLKIVDVDRAGDLLERQLTLRERRRQKRHAQDNSF